MKNYWTYFIASLVSLIGSNYFIFTQGWYLLELTGQKTSVGTTWSIFFLPSLLFLPLAGKLLDSFDLKKVLLGFELAKLAIFVAFIPLLHAFPSPYLVYTLAALYGIAFVPYYPSVYVVVKRLVPDSLQAKYSHLSEVSLQLANVLAVFSSGFLYHRVGFIGLLSVSAASILIGFFAMRRLNFASTTASPPLSTAFHGYRNLIALVRGLRRDRSLSKTQFLFGVFHQFPQAVILVGNVPLILYVFEVMKKGPAEFGVIDAIIGLGALGVSLAWARWHELSHSSYVIIGIAAAAGLAVVGTGLVPSAGLWPYLWMAVYGMLLVSSKILSRAAVVRMVSKEQMGLYSSLFQTCGYVVMMSLFFIIRAISGSLAPEHIFFLLGGALVAYSIGLTILSASGSRCTG